MEWFIVDRNWIHPSTLSFLTGSLCDKDLFAIEFMFSALACGTDEQAKNVCGNCSTIQFHRWGCLKRQSQLMTILIVKIMPPGTTDWPHTHTVSSLSSPLNPLYHGNSSLNRWTYINTDYIHYIYEYIYYPNMFAHTQKKRMEIIHVIPYLFAYEHP